MNIEKQIAQILQCPSFKLVISRAKERVSLPEIKEGFFGVKMEEAQKAVQTAINGTAEKVGEEILSAYNRVLVRKCGLNTIKTTTELNGVTNETFLKGSDGKEYLSRYQRTTPLGTYTIDYSADGVIEKTRIESPVLGAKDTYYVGGKKLKIKSVDDLITLEEKHNANKGAITEHCMGKTVLPREITKYYYNKYKNGAQETLYVDSNETLIEKLIELPNGTRIHKYLETGVTTLAQCLDKGKAKYITNLAYHINPTTGQKSSTQITKVIDEFGRPVLKVDYDIAKDAKIKDIKMVYAMPETNMYGSIKTDSQLISASFDSESLGKIEIKNGKFFINGAEQTGTYIHEIYERLDSKNHSRSMTGAFELLLKEALEKDGVSSELFLPECKYNWINY